MSIPQKSSVTLRSRAALKRCTQRFTHAAPKWHKCVIRDISHTYKYGLAFESCIGKQKEHARVQGSRLARSMKNASTQIGPSIHRYRVRETEESMERCTETETETDGDGDGDGGRGRGRARQTVPVHKVQWRAAGADGSQGEEEAARIGR